MASLFDVEIAIAEVLDTALFNGEGDPLAPTPSNVQLADGSYLRGRVVRGWPLPSDFDLINSSGTFMVTIYPVPNLQRVTTRFRREWEVVSRPTITLSATVSGSVVTLAGVGQPGEVVGIAVGQTGYSVRMASQASPEALAASLAAMIPGATASGPSVQLSGSAAISAGVVADTTMIRPLQTQTQRFLLSIWAPSDEARVALQGRLIGPVIAPDGLQLADGSVSGPAVFRGVSPEAQDERVDIYAARNSFDIEYTTTETKVYPGVLFVGLDIGDVELGIFPPSSNSPPATQPGTLNPSSPGNPASVFF